MSQLIDERRRALDAHLTAMKERQEWVGFQNFVLGLLRHDGYTDVRLSNVRHDFGRDAVALAPDKKRCFVAVSFDGSRTKVLSDAKRWTEDPNREPAEVLLFIPSESPQNTVVSKWVGEIRKKFGLELRLYNSETILSTATSASAWRETCARLGLPGHRLGYMKIGPYQTKLVRAALRARPPEWLRERVPLREWSGLSKSLRNRLILGKPGAGKITTIFEQLELAQPETTLVVSDTSQPIQVEGLLDEAARGAVIVFDDLHERPEQFVGVCAALLARQRDAAAIARQYENVRLIAGCRSQEWDEVRAKLPTTQLQDLGMLTGAELTLAGLDKPQCRRLIEICRDEWSLVIEERLLAQAAQVAAERDATPLYVISMLAAAKGRPDLTLRDEHLAGLPHTVRELWNHYWQKLNPTSQGVLRLVRLFWAAGTEPQPQLLSQAAGCFGIAPVALSATLAALERSLWLTRTAGVPACLDTQLEVMELDALTYEGWDRFLDNVNAEVGTRIQLHNGTGLFYCKYAAPRAEAEAERRRHLRTGARHFEAVGRLGGALDRNVAAISFNNASNACSALADLETTPEGRRAWLDKAVAAVEKSVAIDCELGVRSDLASSLNNASNQYSALAGLETTREGRRAWLDKAVAAVEESVGIYRELGVRGNLASSLSNASNQYSALAGLETTREGRRAWLDKAVAAVEESVGIRRELGVRGDLARSLGALCQHLRSLADTEADPASAKRHLIHSRESIDEAVALFRHAGNSPYLLLSLQDAVVARILLHRADQAIDIAELAALADEGLKLASSMQDEKKRAFFAGLKRDLSGGAAPSA